MNVEIQEYHRGTSNPQFLEFNQEKESYFKIGFEVEKVQFLNNTKSICYRVGDVVHDSKLFHRFERDGSCGVEAVTHILPLGGVKSINRKEVFKMIDSEKTLINYSPTSIECGGHITLSSSLREFAYGINLVGALRDKIAIFYAMFAPRLSNRYCANNTLILNGVNKKYSPINTKRNTVEIRLPNAIKSCTQMKNRYDLCFKLMKYSTIEPITWKQFKNEIYSNMMRIYNKDEAKVLHTFSLADMFRKYLLTLEMTDDLSTFFNADERIYWRENFGNITSAQSVSDI